jgi:PAS domain-containing protein
MGAFVLLFVIRMAGVVMEQKEKAENSMRLSEDRFRSLIQNSSDATIVIDGEGRLLLRQPGGHPTARIRAERTGRTKATEIVHPDDHAT